MLIGGCVIIVWRLALSYGPSKGDWDILHGEMCRKAGLGIPGLCGARGCPRNGLREWERMLGRGNSSPAPLHPTFCEPDQCCPLVQPG